MELHACNVPQTLESITTFSNATFTAGGSAPQTARALTALSIRTSALTVIGSDPHGDTLRKLLISGGVDVSSLVVDSSQCTALAVLPLFADGTRGCFVTLGANLSATVDTLLPRSVLESVFTSALRVFHFGYPHLMPNLQGQNLRNLFERVRQAAPNVLLTMDVNGADTKETPEKPVLIPALELTAAVHANLEEACTITGLASPSQSSTMSAEEIRPVVEWFTEHGAEIACITCGKEGAFVATGGSSANDQSMRNQQLSPQLERGAFIYRAAFAITEGITVNASGAGDAFTAGVIAELAGTKGKLGVGRVADAGLVGALYRIDSSLGGSVDKPDIASLLESVKARSRLAPRPSLCPQLAG